MLCFRSIRALSSPTKAERRKNVEHTERCIDIAAQLGIPAIRLNSGRWNTVKSFDDLMKVKGNEPPISGFTNDDAFKWCVESIRECLPKAEKAGVVLALENHWGLTTSVDMLLRIWREVNSPWLGINLDTGNFPGDPYADFAKVAPHATIVQAKTYYGGGVWYTLDLDYKKMAGILASRELSRLHLTRDGRQRAPCYRRAEESCSSSRRIRINRVRRII